jgi:hypothetical protein
MIAGIIIIGVIVLLVSIYREPVAVIAPYVEPLKPVITPAYVPPPPAEKEPEPIPPPVVNRPLLIQTIEEPVYIEPVSIFSVKPRIRLY